MKTINTISLIIFLSVNLVFSQDNFNSFAVVSSNSSADIEVKKSARNYYFTEGKKHYENANFELAIDFFDKNIALNSRHL